MEIGLELLAVLELECLEKRCLEYLGMLGSFLDQDDRCDDVRERNIV